MHRHASIVYSSVSFEVFKLDTFIPEIRINLNKQILLNGVPENRYRRHWCRSPPDRVLWREAHATFFAAFGSCYPEPVDALHAVCFATEGRDRQENCLSSFDARWKKNKAVWERLVGYARGLVCGVRLRPRFRFQLVHWLGWKCCECTFDGRSGLVGEPKAAIDATKSSRDQLQLNRFKSGTQ